MAINELQILFDLNKKHEQNVLKEHACLTDYGYFFVDSTDGQCYLFSTKGKLNNIKKIKICYGGYVKRDIKKIVIPDSVKSIGYGAFENCTSLASIEIPNSVESIGGWAFTKCSSLTNIKIPESVKSIKYGAFCKCKSLKNVEIPDSVESIGDWAFAKCMSLKSIEIPEHAKSIGNAAFVGCNSLKSIIFKGKTFDQIRAMDRYPWGIKDEAIIKC